MRIKTMRQMIVPVAALAAASASAQDFAVKPLLDARLRNENVDQDGIAREAATIYRLPLKAVQPKLKEIAEKAADVARVEIESPELCGRFTARVMRGVKVQPSPDWLRERLEAIGQNSINNVVDVTNYVMFELGHALHAFDFDKLKEHRIIVRRARLGDHVDIRIGAAILGIGICRSPALWPACRNG